MLDGRHCKIDKPDSFFPNTGVLTRFVFAIFEKGLSRDNSFPTWSETYGLEDGSTGLAHIPAKPIVNARLARQVPRVRVVSSHYSSANIGAPLPPTLSQQELVPSGRPIYNFYVVPISFWQGFYDQDRAGVLALWARDKQCRSILAFRTAGICRWDATASFAA